MVILTLLSVILIKYYAKGNTMTTVVSAKIPDELREKTKLHHIKISKVIRKALEEEVKKIEEDRLSKELDKLSHLLQRKITSKEITKAVRSSRNER